ncbi:hypothetical protein QTP88_001339 [Uroleucon formosanum]
MDLGFKLTSNLDPSLHIEMICCSALRTLGFVMKLAKYFGLKSSLKALYCSFVRPILEYGAVIWDPHTAVNARQLERVQRRFFRFASYLLGIDCPPHDYTSVATNLGLVTLAERRCYFVVPINTRVHEHDIGRIPRLRIGEHPVDMQGSRDISHTFGLDE